MYTRLEVLQLWAPSERRRGQRIAITAQVGLSALRVSFSTLRAKAPPRVRKYVKSYQQLQPHRLIQHDSLGFEGPSRGRPKCRRDTAAGAPTYAAEAGCPDPAAAAAATHRCVGARAG
ncbi:g3988 [Coccomyxa elongata]